jgi:hypothetical protein
MMEIGGDWRRFTTEVLRVWKREAQNIALSISFPQRFSVE